MAAIDYTINYLRILVKDNRNKEIRKYCKSQNTTPSELGEELGRDITGYLSGIQTMPAEMEVEHALLCLPDPDSYEMQQAIRAYRLVIEIFYKIGSDKFKTFLKSIAE